jgi:hypothetical protein
MAEQARFARQLVGTVRPRNTRCQPCTNYTVPQRFDTTASAAWWEVKACCWASKFCQHYRVVTLKIHVFARPRIAARMKCLGKSPTRKSIKGGAYDGITLPLWTKNCVWRVCAGNHLLEVSISPSPRQTLVWEKCANCSRGVCTPLFKAPLLSAGLWTVRLSDICCHGEGNSAGTCSRQGSRVASETSARTMVDTRRMLLRSHVPCRCGVSPTRITAGGSTRGSLEV